MQRYDKKLKELHKNIPLFTRVKILIYDLLNYGNNESSRSRLEKEHGATYYISSVYFTEEQIKYLLSFPSGTGLTLQETLEISIQEKLSNRQETEICASHDLAPTMMLFFGVRKGFKDEKLFKNALKNFEKNFKKNN